MKELFYIGKETSTGEEVLVLASDFDALPKEKAAQSLLDMGVEVDTNKTVLKEVQCEDPVEICNLEEWISHQLDLADDYASREL